MEGTTYLEHLASQMHYEQSCLKSSARPMPDPDLNDHTYVNEDINTDLPESTAPMMNSQMDHKRSCFNPSARLMLYSDIVIPTDVNVDIDADPPENSAPLMNSDLIVLELDDAIRHEVLRNCTMENMSPHELNDQLLSLEYVNVNTAEMFLDQARSVGQRQCNMYMDMEDQFDTVNGVSVYYGGDPYDSEDTEKFDSAVPEGMEFRMPTHSHMDGGVTRRLDIVDMVYMCRTVSGHGPRTHDEELDIARLCRCPEIEDGEDPPVLSDTLHVDIGLDRPEQTGQNCVTGACGVNFDVTDYDSDTDSVAELEYNTWDGACTWEFRNAPGNMFDELIRNTSYYTDDDESPEGFGHEGYVDAGIYPPRLCLLQRHNRLDIGTEL